MHQQDDRRLIASPNSHILSQVGSDTEGRDTEGIQADGRQAGRQAAAKISPPQAISGRRGQLAESSPFLLLGCQQQPSICRKSDLVCPIFCTAIAFTLVQKR